MNLPGVTVASFEKTRALTNLIGARNQEERNENVNKMLDDAQTRNGEGRKDMEVKSSTYFAQPEMLGLKHP